MQKRDFMIAYRESKRLTVEQMALKCNMSAVLLRMIENNADEVTHPDIAYSIKKAYMLTPEQAEGLLPKNYRKSDPEYNPDRYKVKIEPLKPVPAPVAKEAPVPAKRVVKVKGYSNPQKCPNCGKRTSVYRSFETDEGMFKRNRKCMHCKYTFTTLEIMTEELEGGKDE